MATQRRYQHTFSLNQAEEDQLNLARKGCSAKGLLMLGIAEKLKPAANKEGQK